MRRYQKQELLTASEIARYVYCNRAWGYDQKLLRPYRRRQFAIRLISVLVFLVVVVLILIFLLGIS